MAPKAKQEINLKRLLRCCEKNSENLGTADFDVVSFAGVRTSVTFKLLSGLIKKLSVSAKASFAEVGIGFFIIFYR